MSRSALVPIGSDEYHFRHVVGIGGVGSGVIFRFPENRNLGRTESRLAELTSEPDFCKLHIVLHYVSALFRDDSNSSIRIDAVGRVGDDAIGTALRADMSANGISVDHVVVTEGRPTLYSVSFQYPDGDAGNITASNSACSLVTGEECGGLFTEREINYGPKIALALPEVPLPARHLFLTRARSDGALTIASFVSAEAGEFVSLGMAQFTDLLVINREEAMALADRRGDAPTETTEGVPFRAVVEPLRLQNRSITVIVTDGANGCYYLRGDDWCHVPAPNVPVVTTAGAGDAFIAGIVAGLCCGLPVQGALRRPAIACAEPPFRNCLELATAMGALSVGSPGALNRGLTTEKLLEFAIERGEQ